MLSAKQLGNEHTDQRLPDRKPQAAEDRLGTEPGNAMVRKTSTYDPRRERSGVPCE